MLRFCRIHTAKIYKNQKPHARLRGASNRNLVQSRCQRDQCDSMRGVSFAVGTTVLKYEFGTHCAPLQPIIEFLLELSRQESTRRLFRDAVGTTLRTLDKKLSGKGNGFLFHHTLLDSLEFSSRAMRPASTKRFSISSWWMIMSAFPQSFRGLIVTSIVTTTP